MVFYRVVAEDFDIAPFVYGVFASREEALAYIADGYADDDMQIVESDYNDLLPY